MELKKKIMKKWRVIILKFSQWTKTNCYSISKVNLQPKTNDDHKSWIIIDEKLFKNLYFNKYLLSYFLKKNKYQIDNVFFFNSYF